MAEKIRENKKVQRKGQKSEQANYCNYYFPLAANFRHFSSSQGKGKKGPDRTGHCQDKIVQNI